MTNLKILVADDDVEDLDIIKRFIEGGLGKRACTIDLASSYEDVLKFLAKENYDVGLFDLNFGLENGVEMLGKVRKKGHALPVILLTGSGSQEVVVNAFKGGVTDFLDKSKLNERDLLKAIEYTVALDKEKRLKDDAAEKNKKTSKLLEGAAKANHTLLTRSGFLESLESALATLGKAAEADIACIFCHGENGEESEKIKEAFWWERGGKSSSADADLLFSYKELGVEEGALSKAFSSHLARYQDVTLPQKLREWCGIEKLTEFLIFPIIVEGKRQGFLGVGSKRDCFDWSSNEIAIMEMTAGGIGGKMKLYSDEISFRSIVEGTSTGIGEEFFSSLVYNLALSMPVYSASFVEVMGYQNDQCKIVAGWEGDHFVSSYSFSVRDTPCEEIVAGMLTYYPDNVAESFPHAKIFSRLKIRGFAGVPCFDAEMKIIGCLCIADRFPLMERERTLAILKMFASRAGAELERKRSEDVIKNMAYHDALTGLPNRMLLGDRLKMGLAHAHRNKRIMAVLFVDLDGFKEINDNFGHAIGDLVLQEVANRLTQCIREEDTLSRLGGDEFIVFLPRIVSKKDAENLAKKLLAVAQKPFHFEGENMSLSLSIGISFFPEDGRSAKDLLKKADDALYKAKNSGKNTYRLVK